MEKRPVTRLLMTHPGVGPLMALAYELVIGTPEHFHCGKKLASYVGLVPSREESGKGDLIGLDFDKADSIYVAYKAHSKFDATDLADPFHPSCRDATVTRSGVHKIDAKTRNVMALATRADGWPFCYPDDVAIDSKANVYVTDLTYSGIWKISPDAKKVTLWSAHALLNGSTKSYTGFPIGVNDLLLDKEEKNINAVTDSDPMVLRIPIKEDGTAGEPQPVGLPGYSPSTGWNSTQRATFMSLRFFATRFGFCHPTALNGY
ncbi:MAG TPA: transposase [Candidatus Sulfotelmatobacter sp.]|nr:transposase [Candidatus Sulfotelmatobacter sp.]